MHTLAYKSTLGLPSWVRAGYKGIGDIGLACLFALVMSKCFLDSGLRWCGKTGLSCMRRVVDCSSIRRGPGLRGRSVLWPALGWRGATF